MSLPLRTTIPLTAVAIATIAVCFSTPMSVAIGVASTYDATEGEARLFLRQAGVLASTYLAQRPSHELRGLMAAYQDNIWVTNAVIVGPDDRVLDAWGPGAPPSSWTAATVAWPPGRAAELRRRAVQTGFVQSLVDRDQRRIFVVHAVWPAGARAGAAAPHVLALEYDVSRGLDEVYGASMLALAIFFVLIFAMAIAAGTALRWLLRRRSAILLRVARDIAQGNFDARVGASADDEFGAIATAIDDMAARLAETRDRNRQSEERYRTLFDEADDAVVLCDDHGLVQDANHAAVQLFGRSVEQLRGLTLETLVDTGADEAPGGGRSKGAGGGPGEGRREGRGEASAPDGVRIPVEFHVRALTGVGTLALFRDLRRALEATRMRDAMVMQERLAALGTLAAGVGHELNNPLSYVSGNLDLLDAALRSGVGVGPASSAASSAASLRALVDDARDGAARMKRIVGELHVFTRAARDDRTGRRADQTAVAVRAELDAGVQLASHALKGRARVVKELAPSLPPVRGEEGRLTQVIVNMLTNALHAMPADRDEVDNVITLRAAVVDDGLIVAIDVIDNGNGIAADVLPHVFAHFFTTRTGQGGSGLGLSVSRELVLSMGGTLDVESEPGRGTAFRIRLPAARGATTSPPAHVTTQPGVAGAVDTVAGDIASVRVLIVDDDPLVARVLRLMLGAADVTVASGVAEALEAARRFDFDCVLCDLIMPDGGGEAVVRGLQRQDPRLVERVVFMTAGISSHDLKSFVDRAGRPVLEKPVAPATLCAVVAAARRPAGLLTVAAQ
ncbi:MAG: response regulator [Deltaproteobacteria bacterium]|nr:response regulator [Deltaproteobacteria bacterium]